METFVAELASSLLKDLIERLTNTLIDEVTQALGFKAADEVKKLERKLFTAQLLFDNLKNNNTWQHCTGDVFRVCYDVEDLVDDLKVDTSNISTYQKLRTSLKGKRRSTRLKIQEVRGRLEDIISMLELVNKTQQQEQHHVNRNTPVARELLGREVEKEKIITLLLDQRISSVNIVGIGGLGKTTLAWNVQEDPRIQEKFRHNIIWIPVSAEFDQNTVAEYILHQRLQIECALLLHIQGLFEKLYGGESVLIVLDGLWSVTYEDWKLFSSLYLRTSGCKALVTTRNPQVGSNTGARLYHLPLMNDIDCRALVIERAMGFNDLSSRERVVLEEIAGAIAQKSKGLPVAASILGAYLYSNRSEDAWMSLSKRYIYSMREFREEIFPALKPNTADMGSHLKRCLAYCSLFPRNYVFKKSSLVQLWMAEGFISPQDTTSLREIGNEYFEDLYWRSFFQPSQLGEHGVISYTMHEFIHRFAEVVATDVFYRLEDVNFPSISSYTKARHLSLLCSGVQLDLKKIIKCGGLRTFLLPSESGMRVGQISYSFFEKFRRLRVLDLSRTDVDVLPESLGRLKLIRYLDLSETPIQLLPESISNLIGLQVLKLRECNGLLQLPKKLHMLTSFIHLDVDIQSLSCMPASIGSLSHLQILPKFYVGKREGYCITELRNLKLLRDTLNIVDLDNVKDGAEAREAELCEKPLIRRLELEWSCDFREASIATDVFTGLQPHDHLKELKVTNYVGLSFPTWLTSLSCKFVSIHVQDCYVDDVLPSLGQLRFLEILHIEGMRSVQHMSCPFLGAFPELKSLKMERMKHLERLHKLPDNCMPKLNDLTVMDCPKLSSIQSLNLLNSLQTLEINRCPALEALPQLPRSTQSLIIIESDKVKRRCGHEGPEWHMIKSIPRVEIDYIKIVFPSGPCWLVSFPVQDKSHLCFVDRSIARLFKNSSE